MPRLTLRLKIPLYTSAIVVALIALMLAIVNWQAQSYVSQNVGRQLEQDRERIQVIARERINALRQAAQLVASFPRLNALLADTDAPTIRDFLIEYTRENRRAEALIVLDPAGRLLARTDGEEGGIAEAEVESRWMQPALANGSSAGLLLTARGTYDAVAVAAGPTGAVFGFVFAAAPLNDAFAKALQSSSDEEVVLATTGGVLGSTLERARLPWQSGSEWGLMRDAAGRLQSATVAGESYAVLPFWLGAPESGVLAVILQSRDVLLAPYRRIQGILLGVGLLAVAVGALASVRVARSVTEPVDQLVAGTERVTAGNFAEPIRVRSNDEIGDLAHAFNDMMRGLRERADMQKFVSQSTVEMIRSRNSEEFALGRRVQLTVFFSDIRGFTELAEQRPPEEVVQVLNASLSLQADIVRKYGGDVDKFVGDCVVALFFSESSAMDAVQCAIEIEKSLGQFNATLPAGDRIAIGIGIATGEAVLGSIGSEDRRDFTAIGSTVNLCSRLCATAGAGEILLAESSYQHIAEQVPAEHLAPIAIKGFSQPVPVFRISYGDQRAPASPRASAVS
jgi:class 3 adenylate cyclase